MSLMPEFRGQLLDAAAERSQPRGRRRHRGLGIARVGRPRRHTRVGVPIAFVASILVVVVVIAAVLSIGGAGRNPATPGAEHDGRLPGVASARAQLLNELGVLRRGHPSTVAAHFPIPVSDSQIDRSLVRTVYTRGYTVTLIPAAYAPRPASRHRTTGLIVTVQGPHVHSGFPAIDDGAFAIGSPVSPAAIARHGAITIMYVKGPLNRAIVIVPDGIRRVALSRFVPDHSSDGRAAAIAPTSAPVHDNVAVLALPGVTPGALHQTRRTLRDQGGLLRIHRCRVVAALYFVSVTARMTWSRHTGPETTTVATSLNAYSTTLLPPLSCRHSVSR